LNCRGAKEEKPVKGLNINTFYPDARWGLGRSFLVEGEKKVIFASSISALCVFNKKKKTKAMKVLKTMIIAVLLVAGLCSCEKLDMNQLEGTWSEQYDPAVFAMDGSVEYTFDGNNRYQMHVYDALSGESHDYSGSYAIDMINKGTITINPQMSDYSNVTYTLVKLTSKEMVWQKEGTTYSVGTWGSDYRHFVRVK
jgi:hypothetical protein